VTDSLFVAELSSEENPTFGSPEQEHQAHQRQGELSYDGHCVSAFDAKRPSLFYLYFLQLKIWSS